MSERRSSPAASVRVRELIRETTTLTAQGNRSQVELAQTITVEQAILLAHALVGIVRKQVMDLPDANDGLKAIATQFREPMRRPDRVGRA